MLDCTQLSFQDMADLVRAVRIELKRRNPIFVNAYTGVLDQAILALEEIHEGEQGNPTCECGPGIDDSNG